MLRACNEEWAFVLYIDIKPHTDIAMDIIDKRIYCTRVQGGADNPVNDKAWKKLGLLKIASVQSVIQLICFGKTFSNLNASVPFQ